MGRGGGRWGGGGERGQTNDDGGDSPGWGWGGKVLLPSSLLCRESMEPPPRTSPPPSHTNPLVPLRALLPNNTHGAHHVRSPTSEEEIAGLTMAVQWVVGTGGPPHPKTTLTVPALWMLAHISDVPQPLRNSSSTPARALNSATKSSADTGVDDPPKCSFVGSAGTHGGQGRAKRSERTRYQHVTDNTCAGASMDCSMCGCHTHT